MRILLHLPEIISQLKQPTNKTAPLLRPELKSVKGFNNQIVEMLMKTWFESPKLRMTAARVKKEIFTLTNIMQVLTILNLVLLKPSHGF